MLHVTWTTFKFNRNRSQLVPLKFKSGTSYVKHTIIVITCEQNYFNLIGCKKYNLSVIALLKPVQNPIIPDWSFHRVQNVVMMLHWLAQ